MGGDVADVLGTPTLKGPSMRRRNQATAGKENEMVKKAIDENRVALAAPNTSVSLFPPSSHQKKRTLESSAKSPEGGDQR